MTDIIKRLRDEAQDIRANLPNVKTPLFAMKLSDLAALLSEAAQLLERGSWKPSEETVARIIRDHVFIDADSRGPFINGDDEAARAILALSPDPAFLGEIEEASREKPTTCAPDGSPPVHAPRGSLPEDGDR